MAASPQQENEDACSERSAGVFSAGVYGEAAPEPEPEPELKPESAPEPEPEPGAGHEPEPEPEPEPDEYYCRICYEGDRPKDKLFSPCRCKGSCRYIHVSCLNTWRLQVGPTTPYEFSRPRSTPNLVVWALAV